MVKCEICESIIGGDYTPPSLNEKRCADCEFIEVFIKNRCFLCEKKIENDLQHFIMYGNMCIGCNNLIIRELKKRKKENNEILTYRNTTRNSYNRAYLG